MTMSEPFQDPALEGQRRATAWRAHLEASQAASSAAEVEAHRASSEGLRAAHQGLYGHMTPEELGAAVQARAATVGTAWGHGRPLERNGGTFDHAATAPAPARVDLRHADMPPGHQVGESPLARYMRTREQ